MIVRAFRGWRPRSDLASRIPSYPYDVVTAVEARELARDDPYSFLHVVRPEVDLDPEIDPHDAAVYARGRRNFAALIERGWLVRDERPAYYIYRLRMGDHTQAGIVGAATVEDYLEQRILRHEQTRPDKVQDRARLAEALQAHPGSVLLAYRGLADLDRLVGEILATPAQLDFVAPDGIQHALWVVDDPATGARIERLFGHVPAAYVADGHHRAAAAACIASATHERGGALDPAAPSNHLLATFFPAGQLKVLDYNRVVLDLNQLSPEQFLERVRQAGFEVTVGHRARRPPGPRRFGMFLAGGWYLLTAPPQLAAGGVVDQLDVSILSRHLLGPVLGVRDLRTDKRIEFVGGIRGMEALEQQVGPGRGAVAFALHPTSVEEVMRVADAGEIMPPKSTWFEPKLRSGMVVLSLDGEAL